MVLQVHSDLRPSTDGKSGDGRVRSDDFIRAPAYDRKVGYIYVGHSEHDGRRHLSTISISTDYVFSAVLMALQASDSIESQFGFLAKVVWSPDAIGRQGIRVNGKFGKFCRLLLPEAGNGK